MPACSSFPPLPCVLRWPIPVTAPTQFIMVLPSPAPTVCSSRKLLLIYHQRGIRKDASLFLSEFPFARSVLECASSLVLLEGKLGLRTQMPVEPCEKPLVSVRPRPRPR